MRVPWILLSFTLVACVSVSPCASASAAFDSTAREGDLVFQMGEGFLPHVLSATLRDSRGYCHVAIVVLRGGEPWVAHVEPDRHGGQSGARLEPLARFLDAKRSPRAALYRVAHLSAQEAHAAAGVAARFALERRPFDWEFDRSNADRLYCTELVWRAFAEAGCSVVVDDALLERNWKGRRRRIITPGSLLRSGRLVFVASINGARSGRGAAAGGPP
jgi:hypothetical protein